MLKTNDIKYYAPFTSTKQKYSKMKNGKDFSKLDNGRLGAIYFTNIPPTIFKRRAGFTMQTTTSKAVNSKERLGCDSINAEILFKIDY